MKNRPFAYFLVLMTILACSMRLGAQLNCSGGQCSPFSFDGTTETVSAGGLTLVKSQATLTTILASNPDSADAATIAQVEASSDSANASMRAYGTNNVTSRWGVTLGGFSEFSDAAAGNGLILGTRLANPTRLGYNSVTVAEIVSTGLQANGFSTTANCTTAACGAATAGSTIIAAGGTGIVISTTGVTANSQIIMTENRAKGSVLGVTCNTQSIVTLGAPFVRTQTAAMSFEIDLSVAPTSQPYCVDWWIVN